jgi:hypothetical protein
LEPPQQRICAACREDFRQVIVKHLGSQENLQKLLCWPKDEKKQTKA